MVAKIGVNYNRSAIDSLFYRNVLRCWLDTEYYTEKDPFACEKKKAILIESGSSSRASSYDEEPQRTAGQTFNLLYNKGNPVK